VSTGRSDIAYDAQLHGRRTSDRPIDHSKSIIRIRSLKSRTPKFPSFEEVVEKPGLIFFMEKGMVLVDVLEPTPSLQEAPENNLRK
jgi:hypothetical protein